MSLFLMSWKIGNSQNFGLFRALPRPIIMITNKDVVLRRMSLNILSLAFTKIGKGHHCGDKILLTLASHNLFSVSLV